MTALNLNVSRYETTVLDRNGIPFLSRRVVVEFALPGSPSAIAIGKEVAGALRQLRLPTDGELDRTVTEALDLRGFPWGVRVAVTIKE